MKKASKAILLIGTVSLLSWGGTAKAQGQKPPDIPIKELIRRVAVNESRLRDEYKTFLFKQDVTIQSIGGGDAVLGEFRRVSEIIVNDKGEREERITYFPPPTLTGVRITQLDYQDLAGIQPFALTLETLPKYNVTYHGRERIDELETYVFDVRPVKRPNPKRMKDRYFEGRIWVDTVDLVVVKVAGRGLPEDKNNKFPRFETWRENIAKGIWFPTYTYADDFLDFSTGRVHIRMIVRITNYRRFTGGIEILDEEKPTQDEQPPSGGHKPDRRR